jgi:hypothetical protein
VAGRAFPTATNNGYLWDCYQKRDITVGQQLSVVARSPMTTDAGTINFWFSESFISVTTWPTATRALVFHPGINLKMVATSIPKPGATSGSGGSSSSGSGSGSNTGSRSGSGFSIGRLNTGASIGVIVVIVVGVLAIIGLVLFLLRKKLAGRRRRPESPNLTDLYVTPEQKRKSQPGGPYSPLSAKHEK